MSFIKSKVHKTVCGQPLVTTLPTGAILTQFCIIKKSAGEHKVHIEMNGQQWTENKKVEVVAPTVEVSYYCPADGVKMNVFGKAYFCPKCSTIRRKEEAVTQ